MELRTINTFLHIAELHSFSRAARELGYSQSAVSSQIAQLVNALTLFRSCRRSALKQTAALALRRSSGNGWKRCAAVRLSIP